MNRYSLLIISLLVALGLSANTVYNLADYGLKPNTDANSSPLLREALTSILKQQKGSATPYTVVLPKGKYHFLPEGAFTEELFISNHDQDNPKSVGMMIDGAENMTFDGQGSELIFSGRMLPVVLTRSNGCSLKDFSIDFDKPHIAQVKILEQDSIERSTTYEVAPWVDYELRDSVFYNLGHGWELAPCVGIAFEEGTKRLVYNTSDIEIGNSRVSEIALRKLKSYSWYNPKLIPGTVVAFRNYGRPTPGIFMNLCNNTTINDVTVHYAEGMGLVAQLCDGIDLDGFSVCLKGDSDPRYFTTQADATHFSSCRGVITSKHGLYEGMMDDAINVHGTYLKIINRDGDRTVTAQYMHPQAYGFEWGFAGDKVSVVKSKTMEALDGAWIVESIEPVDQPTAHGAKQFRLTFTEALPAEVGNGETFGIENLTWTPEVVFAENTVRNNRARGALFSTPQRVLVENNLFDHTSGTAVLLCGDCNGWFETGACRDVTIRGNYFLNALTNMFQFTNAVISIYPEIPDFANQKKYFHSGVNIEANIFDSFDEPIIYAKSIDGLRIADNIVRRNNAYPPLHWNKNRVLLERATNVANQFAD